MGDDDVNDDNNDNNNHPIRLAFEKVFDERLFDPTGARKVSQITILLVILLVTKGYGLVSAGSQPYRTRPENGDKTLIGIHTLTNNESNARIPIKSSTP